MKQKLNLFRDNNQIVVTSKEVTDLLGKQHSNILTAIRNYEHTLKNIPHLSFDTMFYESSFIDRRGLNCFCYNMTRKGYSYLLSKMSKLKKGYSLEKLLKLFDDSEKEFLKEEELEIFSEVNGGINSILNDAFDLLESRSQPESISESMILYEKEILGKQFRIYGTPDEPLFLAKDVAEWIEYDNSKVGQMLKNVDENEYITSPIYYSGQVRNMYFLTEEGLYEVLMQSRKPIAKEFKKQVKQILKEIRKHRMYATAELLDNPDLLIQVATKLKEEREKNTLLILENQKNEEKINHLTPHADFSKSFLKSEGTIRVGSLAKHLQNMGIKNIGQNRLFKWLRDFNYIFMEEGYNVPTQKSINLGIMEIEEITFFDKFGRERNGRISKITPKGMAYFYKKFKGVN